MFTVISRSTIAAAVILTGLFAMQGTARADLHDHLHHLSLRLKWQLRVLHQEVDAHARPFPQYHHLHEDVVQMQRLAAHIHSVAHHHGSYAHLRADVHRLDRLMHHVEGLIEQLARSGQIGPFTLSHLRRAMYPVRTTVHHMLAHLR
jgi:hypothetical protein